jgi:hypothetical protein
VSQLVHSPRLRVLLLGRTAAVIDEIIANPPLSGIEWIGGTDAEALSGAFAAGPVDVVIIGGGLDLETRLTLVREVFERSLTATVHLNSPSGPASFRPFVANVVAAVRAS